MINDVVLYPSHEQCEPDLLEHSGFGITYVD